MDMKKMVRDFVDWIAVAQDSVPWRALVATVKNLWVI